METGTLPIDICICTFRRAHVAETVRSMAAMELKPDWAIRIIVADNDDTDSARAAVESVMRECNLDYLYIHAPARNISVARNACLDAATADLAAFVDDDELVSRRWLVEMVDTLQAAKADAVMGPVNAVYAPDAPHWMKAGAFHSTMPVIEHGKIVTGGAGNVLMRMDSPAVKGRRFRIDLGKSGGEDSEFFASLYHAGGHIAFAENAVITEEVPASRATMGWLFRRRMRYGQTHGLLLILSGASGFVPRVRAILLAGAKGLFSFGMAALNALDANRMRFWLLRGALHVGVVARLMGGRTIEIYGGGGPL